MGTSIKGSITDVSVRLPTGQEVWEVLTLQSGFNSTVVVLGTTFLGIAAGTIGAFALLRKRALMSDALAHSALPGLALMFIISVGLLGGQRSLPLLLLGATLSGLLGVLSVQFLVRFTRLTEDAAIGIVLSVFFGAGIVLLSIIQNMGTGGAGGLGQFIYGQTAAMRRGDALMMLIAALTVLVFTVALFKEFRLVCFDPDFAQTQGWPVSLLDLLMMSLVVAVTVIGLQSVGMLLVVAMLIIPPAAARFWSERLRLMAVLSGLFGGLSGYAGSVTSTLLPRLPAGAVIVLCAGAIFILSMLFAPARGVIAGAIRQFALMARIAEEHFLRDVYAAVDGKEEATFSLANLTLGRLPRTVVSRFVLLRLRWKKLIRRNGGRGEFLLTSEGRAEARRVTRNHRLWGEYLVRYGNVDTTHVDFSADLAEHVLAPDILRSLEEALLKNDGEKRSAKESGEGAR